MVDVDPLGGLELKRDQLSLATVLLAGVGNIGSPLAAMVARLGIRRLLLLDRDRVEAKNVRTQDYRPEDVGRFKAAVVSERLQSQLPMLQLETITTDLEDTPRGVFDVDLILGALDSRRARQLLVSEIAWPLGVPVVDGGVGEGLRGRVQVFVPGANRACLECGWSQDDYRFLAAEYPCLAGQTAQGPATIAPAFIGATVAGLMSAEAVRLLGGVLPEQNHEIAFDLYHQRFLPSRLRHNPRCRFDHRSSTQRQTLHLDATVGELLALCGDNALSVETGRRARGFAPGQRWEHAELTTRAQEPLLALGLEPRDLLRVRSAGTETLIVLAAQETSRT